MINHYYTLHVACTIISWGLWIIRIWLLSWALCEYLWCISHYLIAVSSEQLCRRLISQKRLATLCYNNRMQIYVCRMHGQSREHVMINRGLLRSRITQYVKRRVWFIGRRFPIKRGKSLLQTANLHIDEGMIVTARHGIYELQK